MSSISVTSGSTAVSEISENSSFTSVSTHTVEQDSISSKSLEAMSNVHTTPNSSLKSLDAPEVRTKYTSPTATSISDEPIVISTLSSLSSGLRSISPQSTSRSNNGINIPSNVMSGSQLTGEVLSSMSHVSNIPPPPSDNTISDITRSVDTSSFDSTTPLSSLRSNNGIAQNSDITSMTLSTVPNLGSITVNVSPIYSVSPVVNNQDETSDDQTISTGVSTDVHTPVNILSDNTNNINTIITRTRLNNQSTDETSSTIDENHTIVSTGNSVPAPVATELSVTRDTDEVSNDKYSASEGTSTLRINTQTTGNQITTTLSGTVTGSSRDPEISSAELLNGQPNSSNTNSHSNEAQTSLAGEARTRSSSNTGITTTNSLQLKPSGTGSSYIDASSRSMDAEARTRLSSSDPLVPTYHGIANNLHMNKLLSTAMLVIYAFF